MKIQNNAGYLAQTAAIAALYIILTYLSALMGLSSGAIQLRLSEMLCILPMFIGSAVPGLTVGCFLSNIITGCDVWDVIFGTFATFLGSILTYCFRQIKVKDIPIPSLLAPVLSNTLIIPFVLCYAYGIQTAIPVLMLTVGLGELISAAGLGYILYRVLGKYSFQLFSTK